MRLLRLVIMSVATMLLSAGYAYAQADATNIAGGSGSQDYWTADEVRMMCEARSQGQKRRAELCNNRNRRKVGRLKTLGEIQELQSLRASMPGMMSKPAETKEQKKSSDKDDVPSPDTAGGQTDSGLQSQPSLQFQPQSKP